MTLGNDAITAIWTTSGGVFRPVRMIDGLNRVELPISGHAFVLTFADKSTLLSSDMRIVCGHWSALGYHDADGVLCIDTGCVWGASLCAARLDRRELPVTVPCSSAGLSVDGD